LINHCYGLIIAIVRVSRAIITQKTQTLSK